VLSRIARSKLEAIKQIKAIPIIKPFAWDKRSFLYINKNMIAIPKNITSVMNGRILLRKLVVGAKLMTNTNTKMKIKMILNLNLLNCFLSISLLLYMLKNVMITSKPIYKIGITFTTIMKNRIFNKNKRNSASNVVEISDRL